MKQYRPRKETYVVKYKYETICKAKQKKSFSGYVIDIAYERALDDLKKIEKANREIKS